MTFNVVASFFGFLMLFLLLIKFLCSHYLIACTKLTCFQLILLDIDA